MTRCVYELSEQKQEENGLLGRIDLRPADFILARCQVVSYSRTPLKCKPYTEWFKWFNHRSFPFFLWQFNLFKFWLLVYFISLKTNIFYFHFSNHLKYLMSYMSYDNNWQCKLIIFQLNTNRFYWQFIMKRIFFFENSVSVSWLRIIKSSFWVIKIFILMNSRIIIRYSP